DRHVPIDLETRPRFGPPVRPDDAGRHGSGRVAKSGEHPRIVGRRVAAVGARAAPDRQAVRSDYRNPRSKHVAAAVLVDEPQADPVPALADSVQQQPQGAVRVADHDVCVAIVVDVAKGGTAADLGLRERGTRSIRDVLEPPVSQIPKRLLTLLQGEALMSWR